MVVAKTFVTANENNQIKKNAFIRILMPKVTGNFLFAK